VVCPHSVASAGLVHTLEEAGIPHGPEPSPGIAAHCVVLCVQAAVHIPPDAMDRMREESTVEEGTGDACTGDAGDGEADVDRPILVFASQDYPKLSEASLRGGARGFFHAGMTP
jgi:hypothetical protein